MVRLLICFLLTITTAHSQTLNRVDFQFEDNDKDYELDNRHKLPVDITLINQLKKRKFKNPFIKINDGQWHTAEVKTRGQGCLVAFRKCFGVDMEESAIFTNYYGQKIKVKHFDLISLREDNGYTSMDIGYNVYSDFGLFPLKREYTQVFVNGVSKGLYYVVEDTDHYFKKNLEAAFAGRTEGIFYSFTPKYFNQENTQWDEKDFLKEFKDLISIAKDLDGEGFALYNELKKKMDIDQFIEYMAINTFIMNSDYSDEIFFYALNNKNDTENTYFKIMAWDPDALFKGPHATPYNTIIWRKRIKKTLFYSMENKFDRSIAKDPYINILLARKMKDLIQNRFTPEYIDNIINLTKTKILPYLELNTVLEPSINDPKRTAAYTKNEILNILESKRNLLMNQRNILWAKANEVESDWLNEFEE